MKAILNYKLSIIIFFTSIDHSTCSAQIISFFHNFVCSGVHEIPYYPTTIDPYHLPQPCINYGSYLDNTNFDLVFEDNFDSPLTPDKWVSIVGQRAKMVNDINNPNPFSTSSSNEFRPQIIDFNDGYGGLPDNFDLTSVPGTLKLIAKPVPLFWDNQFTYHDGTNPVGGGNCCPVYDIDDCPTTTPTPDPSDCILDDGFPNKRHFSYTSGLLTTERNFKYGYFEMRCKIPTIDGIWPAFWLFNQGGNRTEIDIFEFAQRDKPVPEKCIPEDKYLASQRMFLTYWDWQGPSLTDDDDHHLCSSIDAIAEDFLFVNTWHTYALYWDEFKLIWLLDGSPIYSVYHYHWVKKNIFGEVTESGVISNCNDLGTQGGISDHEIQANFYWPDEQCKLIVNIAVKNFGGAYNSDLTLDQTCSSLASQTSMEIDYIRVYGIRSCNNSGTVYYCSDNPDHVQSYITATDNLVIAAGCEVIVKNPTPEKIDYYNSSSHYVDAIAGNEISLLPGFEAQAGAEFRASIQPCATADLRHASTGNNILSSQQIKDQIKLADNLAKQKDSLQNKPAEPQNIFEVYPNPTTGTIQFNISENLSNAVILDITGSIVLEVSNQVNNKSGYQTINLNSLSKGVYILRVSTETNTYLSNKIILN